MFYNRKINLLGRDNLTSGDLQFECQPKLLFANGLQACFFHVRNQRNGLNNGDVSHDTRPKNNENFGKTQLIDILL